MNKEIVDKINQSPYKAFFAIAGGGQSFIGDYCNISGASQTVIGAIIPYSQVVFEKFIKGKVDTFASPEGSRKLAVASFNECLGAGVDFDNAIGIGASSAVGKDHERNGRVHKIHVTVHCAKFTQTNSLFLQAGRTREEEDAMISKLILDLLTYAALDINLGPVPLRLGEYFNVDSTKADPSVVELLKGKTEFIQYNGTTGKFLVVYPGSWNPLHDGHEQIAKLASEIMDTPVTFELTIKNTEKPELDFVDLERRVQQFNTKNYPLILTKASTFVKKIQMLREWHPDKQLVMVVGADTWNRIWDEKYGYTISQLRYYFDLFRVKFLVFGRNCELTPLGDQFRIKNKQAEAFCSPISSSELRKKL
jgi:nicotinic acid mononucleotide adenylyltransferase